MGGLLNLFLVVAAADILGKELGRWGLVGAVRTRWPSLVLAGVLGIIPTLLTPWLAVVAGIAFIPAFFVYRARHIGAWNVVGVDMHKVSRIGDAFTAVQERISGTALWVADESSAAQDPFGVLTTFLKDDADWRIRRCAAEAIGQLQVPRSIDYLQQGLYDRHWRVQLECMQQLVGAARAWSYDVAVVRSRVAHMLEEFLGSTAARHPRVRQGAAEAVLSVRQSSNASP